VRKENIKFDHDPLSKKLFVIRQCFVMKVFAPFVSNKN